MKRGKNKAEKVEKADLKKTEDQLEESGLTLEEQELLRYHGIEGIIRLGLASAGERVFKNRLIYSMLVLCVVLGIAVFGLSTRTIEPVILSEDRGKIRPLPLLTNPIYSHDDILTWADRCIRDIYSLSYVDWKESIRTNTMCLSDKARQNFVTSLGEIGLLQVLTPSKLGITYAIPGKPSVRMTTVEGSGAARQYHTWVIEIPFVVHLEGRERGMINLDMVMKVTRVPMSIRDAGIWVDDYKIQAGVRK